MSANTPAMGATVAAAAGVAGVAGRRTVPQAAEPTRSTRRGPFRVDRVMGTVVTIDVRDPGVDRAAVDGAFAYLHDVDARFSPFRPGSEVSRLAHGEIDEDACSPDLRHVLALCDDLRRTSGGFFDIRRHRLDGLLDPCGMVKGWAVEEASMLLEAAGATDYFIGAGGDIVAAGGPAPDRPWRVGIRHPFEADRVAAVLEVRDRGVATSGAYERGDHIRDPHTGRPPTGLVSLTVVGPGLTWTDAYATTGFAMGEEGIAWVGSHAGYGAFAITADGRTRWTADLDGLLA
jgi:FAD:protein FMN transferase